MNQKKLAELAGVSPATVSKAFRYSDRIGAETRERIFRIAREQQVFERLSKGKYHKKLIVVFCPEIKSDYYNHIVNTLEKEILSHNSIMSLVITDFDPEKEREYFSFYSRGTSADAIVAINPRETFENPDSFPMVAMMPLKAQSCDSLYINRTDAMNEAISLLKKNGRENILFIGEGLTMRKAELFRQCMENNQLPVLEKQIFISDQRFEQAGIQAVEALIERKEVPDAIVAAYDYVAFGAIQALKKNGLRVPQDVSVIGMDDISLNHYAEIPLTTIGIQADALCRKAVEMLIKRIENRAPSAPIRHSFPATLVCREST